MNRKSICALLIMVTAIASGQADTHARKPKRPTPKATSVRATQTVPEAQENPDGRIVRYNKLDVIKLRAKLRYSTVIILPKGEQILDYVCGDKDFWIVDGDQNFATVKPAKLNSKTNLNLITASGNVYSFALAEISETPNAEPDLKVFVELAEDSMKTAARGKPKFVPVQVLDDYQQQVALAKEETRKARDSVQPAIDNGITRFLASMRFPYRFEAGKRPFNIRAIYNDDRFTYIRARPEETPALYEIKDGQPNLVNFEYKDGAYVVSKILDSGYLTIGKQKQKFIRQE